MKKTLLLIVAFVLVSALSILGTVAYLTYTDKDVNTFVMGNVEIRQNETDRKGKAFVQDQTMLPIVGTTAEKDANGYPAAGNYVDKIVTVTNTGNNDAYVRTYIAIPQFTYAGQSEESSANVLHWNCYSASDTTAQYPAANKYPDASGSYVTADNDWYYGASEAAGDYPADMNTFEMTYEGQTYDVYVITHKSALEPNQTTAPNMIGVYMDSRVDYVKGATPAESYYTFDGKKIDGMTSNFSVLVATEAVQADGGWTDAWEALNTAFGVPSATNNPWAE